MKKLPTCKNCGRVGHYTYQCWAKKKTTPKPLKTRSNKRLGVKKVNISSAKKKDQSLRRKLIKDLDKYCSWYIRLSASDKNGIMTCYCCGTRLPWRLGDCAHYCKRSYMGTRWDLDNLKPNCVTCNRYKNGNYTAYEQHLKIDIGIDGIQKLWDKAFSHRKFSTPELQEMLVEIKQKYKALLEERKSKGWVC